VTEFGSGKRATRRGPYGTNEGDVWLAPDSPVQARLDADGEGTLVHEMIRQDDGVVREGLYVTKDPELLERARRGHEEYVEAVASTN
jgi:hypothetical protein